MPACPYMRHAKPSKIFIHCKLTSGAPFTYFRTDIWNGFPQRSALQVLQYIFSYLFLYISTQFWNITLRNSWEVFKYTVHNLQECLRLNNHCYFFSSFYKHIEVVHFHIRNFDNIEFVSFHKHFWLYWSSKATSRCRNRCILDGTWLWVVKKYVRHEWFPISCCMTYFAT